jgi:hypothetical protein
LLGLWSNLRRKEKNETSFAASVTRFSKALSAYIPPMDLKKEKGLFIVCFMVVFLATAMP